MGWIIFAIIIGAIIIASSVSSNRKKQEEADKEKKQIETAMSRTVSLTKDSTTLSWSMVPQSMSVFSPSFVLSVTDGPSFMMRFTSGVRTKFFINDEKISEGSLSGMNDTFPFSIDVNGTPISGKIVYKVRVTSENSLTLYLEDQFIGEMNTK